MNKGQRISQLLGKLEDAQAGHQSGDVADDPCYRGFFQCWNGQRYYEGHDVLEHLWLRTDSDDANYFKGLIQAAGAFVHLQKQHARPNHPKDGRRLYPAVRLFRLAEKNLGPYAPMRHRFDVAAFLGLLRRYVDAILAAEHTINPWSPDSAPLIGLELTAESAEDAERDGKL